MANKQNSFMVKMKQDKGARAIAITVTVMLLLLAAIIVTTIIANRAIPTEDEEMLPTHGGDSDPAAILDPVGDEDEEPAVTPVDEPDPDALPARFLLPVSGVMTKKHDASVQVFSSTMGDYRVHLGIDVATVDGAAVSAMADGVIAQVFDDVSMGKCVAIRHSGDAYTIYKNLAPDLPETVVAGAPVKAGDVIGNVGASAMTEIAEEPHLHLEMTVGGLQVDPTEYLDAAARATLNEVVYEDEVS